MTKTKKAAIFPTRSQLGQELALSAAAIAKAQGYQPIIYHNATHALFFQACLTADAVILDATLESDLSLSNYHFATPFKMDRELVVARTYTPINFYGTIDGGTAKYSDLNHAWGQKTNADILTWLSQQLSMLAQQQSQASWLTRLVTWLPAARLAWEMNQSLNARRARLQAEAFVFLSYRSTHFEQVKQLQQRLVAGELSANRQQARLFYFDPGQLVFEDELLSPLRRWQMLSWIQDYLLAAKEIWLCLSPDFLQQSWWTQGELLSVLQFGLVDKLWLFDLSNGQLVRPDITRLPTVTERDKRKMSHYQANSHPDLFAPETLDRNRMLSPLGDLALVRKLFMMDSPVFSEAFWRWTTLPCRQRRIFPAEVRPDGLSSFYAASPHVNLGEFLKVWNETDVILSEDDLEHAAAGRKSIVCATCQQTVTIHKEARPRYIWVPQPDAGQATADGNEKPWGRLEAFPVYRSRCGTR